MFTQPTLTSTNPLSPGITTQNHSIKGIAYVTEPIIKNFIIPQLNKNGMDLNISQTLVLDKQTVSKKLLIVDPLTAKNLRNYTKAIRQQLVTVLIFNEMPPRDLEDILKDEITLALSYKYYPISIIAQSLKNLIELKGKTLNYYGLSPTIRESNLELYQLDSSKKQEIYLFYKGRNYYLMYRTHLVRIKRLEFLLLKFLLYHYKNGYKLIPHTKILNELQITPKTLRTTLSTLRRVLTKYRIPIFVKNEYNVGYYITGYTL